MDGSGELLYAHENDNLFCVYSEQISNNTRVNVFTIRTDSRYMFLILYDMIKL